MKWIISTKCCAKINEKKDKFYRKFAFPMYTEIVNFRPQSWKAASKLKPHRGLGTRLPSSWQWSRDSLVLRSWPLGNEFIQIYCWCSITYGFYRDVPCFNNNNKIFLFWSRELSRHKFVGLRSGRWKRLLHGPWLQ